MNSLPQLAFCGLRASWGLPPAASPRRVPQELSTRLTGSDSEEALQSAVTDLLCFLQVLSVRALTVAWADELCCAQDIKLEDTRYPAATLRNGLVFRDTHKADGAEDRDTGVHLIDGCLMAPASSLGGRVSPCHVVSLFELKARFTASDYEDVCGQICDRAAVVFRSQPGRRSLTVFVAAKEGVEFWLANEVGFRHRSQRFPWGEDCFVLLNDFFSASAADHGYALATAAASDDLARHLGARLVRQYAPGRACILYGYERALLQWVVRGYRIQASRAATMPAWNV